MATLKDIVEKSDSPLGRAFDLSIMLLIALSLISFSIETLPDLSSSARRWLQAFETFSVGVFTVEYLLRLHFAEPKRAYALSFFGIIDLAAILPFYLGTGLDLRSARGFRLLRLFRVLKFSRYSSAAARFHRALSIAKEEIILFACATALLLYLAAVGIHHFESRAQPELFGSVFHCLWWGVTTLTTVGYGDAYPITVGGKIFTFVILMTGLGVISVPAGLVASALGKARRLEDEEAAEAAAESRRVESLESADETEHEV